MGLQQRDDKDAFEKSQNWHRLAFCINHHIRKALVAILHNDINHRQIRGLPSDPFDLFSFMKNRQNKLKAFNRDQQSQLIPSEKMVFSNKLDITILRRLIQTFSGIQNEDRNWNMPRDKDHSIAAAVFRAAEIRNKIFHHNDPESIKDEEFEAKWCMIENILADLQYMEDISDIKYKRCDPSCVKQLHSNMAKDFEKILLNYKEKCKNERKDELETFIQRQYENKSTHQIVTNLDVSLLSHDSLMLSGEAGLGKTFSAKKLRYMCASDEILTSKKLLYIDSKRVNRCMYKPSYAAPICVSELGEMLKDETDEYLESFGCVKKPVKDLIVIIDGVDELPIEEDNLDLDFLKTLQVKIDKNSEISAMETIMGIYFGLFFPGSKIIAFGRRNEIGRLKSIQDQLQKSTLFNQQTRAVLELQPLNEDGVKELISRATCNRTSCDCEKCTYTYNIVKDVEFRNVPSHLMALVKSFEDLPDPNFGRITKTKIFIITIFNLLKNHTQRVFLKDLKIFKKLVSSAKTHKFCEGIQNIAKICFFSFLDKNVTIKVEEYKENDVVYFKYEKTIGYNDTSTIIIKRDILEQLDFFYVRDFEYYVTLEPYHLTNMEFLSACYLFSHPDKWDSMLKLNMDRQLVIISFIAGLHSDDHFTNDFVNNVLKISDDSIDKFFSWLYSVKNVRYRLPKGGSNAGYKCWFGLMENQKLSPSFFLLNSISNEVEIPQNFIPKSIVCYCVGDFSFEWYDMKYLKGKSDQINIVIFPQ